MRLCSVFIQSLFLFSLAGAQPTRDHNKRTDVSSYQNSIPLSNGIFVASRTSSSGSVTDFEYQVLAQVFPLPRRPSNT